MSELNISQFSKDKEISESVVVTSPFAPARPSPQELLIEDLFLSGVVISDATRYALISGYILHEGDSVAGLRVKLISKNKVILQQLDRVHTLNLDGGL